jgi:leucyl-tRNA synthetase
LPTFDPELAREETVTLVIQVDGKVRDRVEVRRDATEDDCREAAMASPKVAGLVEEGRVARVIVRAPGLVNIVTVEPDVR